MSDDELPNESDDDTSDSGYTPEREDIEAALEELELSTANRDVDDKMFGAMIDGITATIVNERLDHGEKSDLIRKLANVIAYKNGYNERDIYDIELSRIEKELEETRRTIREKIEKAEALERDARLIRERREQHQTIAERIDDSLISIEQELRTGTRVSIEHGGITPIARQLGVSAEKVHDRLRERNPDVPEYAFEEMVPFADNEEWNGVPEADVNLPLDQREPVDGGSR